MPGFIFGISCHKRSFKDYQSVLLIIKVNLTISISNAWLHQLQSLKLKTEKENVFVFFPSTQYFLIRNAWITFIIGKKNNKCEFQVTLPYLDFCPNSKFFIVQNINEWNLVKYGGKY